MKNMYMYFTMTKNSGRQLHVLHCLW